MTFKTLQFILAGSVLAATPSSLLAQNYDVLIRGGTIYDGTGADPYVGDVAIKGDKIVAIGTAKQVTGKAKRIIDASGLAVAPGFINMLSWSTDSYFVDGKSQSDIRQGVTLEVMGEGWSMGPINANMRTKALADQDDIRYPITWTTLGQYLDTLAAKGVSPNIASFVGATTVRIHELGEGDVDPTPQQLSRMRMLVRQAMNEGAMGVGSSLIYPPAAFAETPELVALANEAGKCGGMYISHIRNEGNGLLPAVDEVITISRSAKVPAEIYHLKQSGEPNWGKLDAVIAKIEAARKEGLRITADMYTYPASSTGLTASLPLWVQEGGHEKMWERLSDPAGRARVIKEMEASSDVGESAMNERKAAGTLLLDFKNPALRPLIGKTLAAVAKERGKSPSETAIDLLLEDKSRIGVAYFTMSEANVARQTALPWMAFGSDAGSTAPEGVFLLNSNHPRGYGNFARLLGKYVREEKTTTLADAVRRLTFFPATNLGIAKTRGKLGKGYFADVVVFDPATIGDSATFESPKEYAVGMRDVFVNGVQVLKDGDHTGATPGRVVRGPGYGKCQ